MEILGAKEAWGRSVKRQEEMEREKTVKCNPYLEHLVNKLIPEAIQRGETKVHPRTYELSNHHVSILRDAGYLVAKYDSFFEVSWDMSMSSFLRDTVREETKKSESKSESEWNKMKPGNPLYDSLYY